MRRADTSSASRAASSFLDAFRWVLGLVFLAGYALSSLTEFRLWEAVFLAVGCVLYFLSVPRASRFHKGFALAAFLTLGIALVSRRFDVAAFAADLPSYFGIVAVLMVLSVAGYPIRAPRYEVQIRALLTRLARRGVRPKSAVAGLGHLLGTVLDVGAFVLMDVICRRTIPTVRVDALAWTARAFAFAPLWSNLNILTVITIELTGISYPALLAVGLPFVVAGLVFTLLLTQVQPGALEAPAEEKLDRGAAAVLAYPVLLVLTVALANRFSPDTPLTVVLALTVGAVVLLVAAVATLSVRRSSPVRRLAREGRTALVASHAEFAIFGSAGVFVLSLTQLGALAPIGSLFAALDAPLVVPALVLAIALGFVFGVHSIPMVLLIDAAFPLSETATPALWAVAVLVGNGAGMLMTPFSNTTTMLSRLTGAHPLEIGPARSWKFALPFAAAGTVYLVTIGLLA